MNIKKLLIERERIAYIRGETEQANFLDNVLEYVIALEEQINVLQREADEAKEKENSVRVDVAALSRLLSERVSQAG